MTELSSMVVITTQDIIKVIAAFLVGLVIGAEREYHDKAAGMRTITLITVGSALFTIFSVRIAGDNDPGRIAAQVVSGIGFLGAGVIIQRRGQVLGLTTAATIWIGAAMGIGMGTGYILFTFIAAALIMLVLAVLPRFQRRFQNLNALRLYKITLGPDPGKPALLLKMFEDNNLKVREENRSKAKDTIGLMWSVAGKPKAHQQVCAAMLSDPDVKEFDY